MLNSTIELAGVDVSLPPDVSEAEAQAWLAQLPLRRRWALFLPLARARRSTARLAAEGRIMPLIGTAEMARMNALVDAIRAMDPSRDEGQAIGLASALVAHS